MTMQRVALIYDFDGTLAKGNVQEHSYIPNFGLTAKEFWSEVKQRARKHDADEILAYMWYMLDVAKQRHLPITRAELERHGMSTPLFEGLDTWFSRTNKFGTERGLSIDHYIISSGNHELINGSSITSEFRHIWASKFIYDDEGIAVWPGLAINYTNKTQFLFRINKGIENSWDSEAINRWIPMEERDVPFTRMVFFGDGDTDIPSMKMVRHQGGCAVAVFDPEEFHEERAQVKIARLISEDRVNYVAPADYRSGSQLEVITRGIIGRIARVLGYRGA